MPNQDRKPPMRRPRGPARVRWLGPLLAAMATAGCMTFAFDPPPPAVAPAAADQGARLVVFIEYGEYHDARSLRGFELRVDGEPRAWIEQLGGRAEVSVRPGTHELILFHRWRQLGLFFGLPVPESGALQSRLLVSCAQGDTCAVAYWPVLDRQKGLGLAGRELAGAELDRARGEPDPGGR